MLSRELLLISSAACTLSLRLLAADLPPDAGNEIPLAAKRESVVLKSPSAQDAAVPAHELSAGYTLMTAAAAPLVTHPIMGCVDDRGRLFIGDAVGVNWNKAQLEANPPNRILLLEDADGDGAYDRSTVFADKMTFPQGAAWLNGSLYVCSPPGLWKLTDTNDDGVADERQMIVGGFDYTGNAADVHGPKLHPNGRLYWCHGRKGHQVVGKDGKTVHEGKASGVWSCLPDGGDVQWHSLGCADNPTGLAFTPQGDILGTCNLYGSNPRVDTLMHWLYGGVYERADQMQAIAGLPRTLETMPVVHPFGHVAVSGCTFGRFGQSSSAHHLYVTHFNTQRLVRMELQPDGATFKAVENEFLKIHHPDVHLTDVIEDRDGSLIVLNTGGWFRIGCPASLMAKPDMLGSIYRVRKSSPAADSAPMTVPAWKPDWQLTTTPQVVAQMASADPRAVLHALAAAARVKGAAPDLRPALMKILARPLEPALEHAAIYAALQGGGITVADVREAGNPVLLRRLLAIVDRSASSESDRALNLALAAGHLDSPDAALAKTALAIAVRHPDADRTLGGQLQSWLGGNAPSPPRLQALEVFCAALVEMPETQKVITAMLGSSFPGVRDVALKVLSSRPVVSVNARWLPLLDPSSDTAREGNLPALLAALKRLKAHPFDAALQSLANDAALPLSLRLKALDAMKGFKLTGPTFDLLLSVLTDSASSSAARIQAASMLAVAPLQAVQIQALAPAFAKVGPVELKELLALVRKAPDAALARVLATALAENPALISQQQSLYRTAFSNYPPEIFESVILPALRRGEELMDSKKRQLGPLADRVLAEGSAAEGQKHFQLGKGTCVACHKIGNVGRAIGPDLSKIGAIRTERDLLESILFPSNTLARDYEAHVFETRDGQTTLGVIRSHTAEGLLIMDIAGQEKSLAHDQIISDTTLTTSLMPMGLDATLPEKELLDLVAYLRSLK